MEYRKHTLQITVVQSSSQKCIVQLVCILKRISGALRTENFPHYLSAQCLANTVRYFIKVVMGHV